jgi:transposase
MGEVSAVTKEVVWVGLDVHQSKVTVAVAKGEEQPRLLTNIANDSRQLAKLLQRLAAQGELRCAYEAGPTGYGLYRLCQRLHLNCQVIAPSLIPRKPGERIKTDRRDAIKLCRCLRNGDLTPVWVPDGEHEALRDLVRAREDAVVDRMRIRHRVSKLLVRRTIQRPHLKAWSKRDREWLANLAFDAAADQIVWKEYLDTLNEVDARIARYNVALREQAAASPKAYLITALQMLKGLADVNSVTVVAELGDLLRFRKPAQLFAYVGLVPSEDSSGESRRQGSITKAGNHHLRRALVESAWSYRYPPAFKNRLRQLRQGAPQWLVDLSWRAQDRLHRRYRSLIRANKPKPVALTAIARELLAFIWELAHELERRQLALAV